MRFWLGLAIGLALGAVGMYLALEPPWAGGGEESGPSVAAADTADAGVPAKKKGRRKARGGGRGGGTAGDAEPFEVDEQIVLTDADRRLEWKGDAVALPPRTVDMAGGDDGGRPLDDGEIQGGIARGSGPVIGCIKDATAGAAIAAEVTLQMLVGADGRVTKVRVRAPAWLHDHGLLACARRAARAMSFPATGAPTIVTAPYHLD
ncbi:MAG: hypothetical protein K8M05_09535 [Deltaproteobacteria bacterium]|nr:hypothetical protein [Kofleriaceae bacterium]